MRRLVLRRSSPGLDTRSIGTMSQYLREMFAETDGGFTRSEIKDLLSLQPQFRGKIEANKRAYHNAIANLLFRGDIERREEKLYATQILKVQRRGLSGRVGSPAADRDGGGGTDGARTAVVPAARGSHGKGTRARD